MKIATQKNANAIAKLFWRECLSIKNRASQLALTIVYPIAAALILFYLFHAGTITQVPIAVIDRDSSTLSRTVIQRLAAAPEIVVAERFNELQAAKRAIVEEKIYAAILIPPNFQQNSLAGKNPEITAFYNNQFMTVGSVLSLSISNAMNGTLSEISLSRLTQTGTPLMLAKRQLQPIPVDLHPLFNPTLNYLYTLVNGLYPAILQIIIMMASASSLLRDRYRHSAFKRPLSLANNSIFNYALGKFLPYFSYFTLVLGLFDLILVNYYSLPVNGHFILLLLGTMLFVFTSVLYGILFGLINGSKSQAYGSVSIFSSPAFGFTGLIFPRLSMNLFAYIWAALLPITWYIEIRLDQTLRAPNLYQSLKPFAGLLVQAFVALVIIGLLIRKMKRAAS